MSRSNRTEPRVFITWRPDKSDDKPELPLEPWIYFYLSNGIGPRLIDTPLIIPQRVLTKGKWHTITPFTQTKILRLLKLNL